MSPPPSTGEGISPITSRCVNFLSNTTTLIILANTSLFFEYIVIRVDLIL